MNEPRGVWAKPAEKGTGQGGAGSAMCGGEKKKESETISGIIFDRLSLFENYFQSVMAHCGNRITLNNAAGGECVCVCVAVLYIQADVEEGFGRHCRAHIG